MLTLTAMTMGFVNTTSTQALMRMFETGVLKLDALITHGMLFRLFGLADFAEFNLQSEGEKAYSTFGKAADHKALKMIMTT